MLKGIFITGMMERYERFDSSYGDVNGEEFCQFLKKALLKKKGVDSIIEHGISMSGGTLIGLKYHHSSYKRFKDKAKL